MWRMGREVEDRTASGRRERMWSGAGVAAWKRLALEAWKEVEGVWCKQ